MSNVQALYHPGGGVSRPRAQGTQEALGFRYLVLVGDRVVKFNFDKKFNSYFILVILLWLS